MIAKLQISVLLSLVLLSVAIVVVGQTRSINKAQARELVLKQLQSEGIDTSSRKFVFELDEINDPDFADFYEFEARLDNPDRFDNVGTYFVDPRTADLQELNTCDQPTAKTVLNFQAQLRKSISLSDSEYGELKKDRPLPCVNN